MLMKPRMARTLLSSTSWMALAAPVSSAVSTRVLSTTDAVTPASTLLMASLISFRESASEMETVTPLMVTSPVRPSAAVGSSNLSEASLCAVARLFTTTS